MTSNHISRRSFLGRSATGAGLAAGIPCPVRAAAQSAGIQPNDFIVKEVKVYTVDSGRDHEVDHIAAIVTNGGWEGNYTLGLRYPHPNWSNLGWLDYAKSQLPGKSVLDLPALTSQWSPTMRRLGQLSYASAIDNCAWDIMGKALGLPVYRLLGAYRDRVRAYASSQHLQTVEAFVDDLQRARNEGFTAYKIHPPWLPGNTVDIRLDIEVAIDQDRWLARRMKPIGIHNRVAAGGHHLHVLESGGTQPVHRPLRRPLHIACVLRQGGDAGNPEQLLELVDGALLALLQVRLPARAMGDSLSRHDRLLVVGSGTL